MLSAPTPPPPTHTHRCHAVSAQLASLIASLATSSSSSSSGGLQSGSSAPLMASTQQVPAPLLLDTVLPVITVLEGGYPSQPFVNTQGEAGVITTLVVGAPPYIDPGATATKLPANNPAHPLNLTSLIMVSGLSLISTVRPTPPAGPFVVSYDCRDLVSLCMTTMCI